MKKSNIVLGLMSGTSADGLTICAVNIRPFKVLAFKNYPFNLSVQRKLLNAYQLNAAQLSALHYELGALYARLTKHFLKAFSFSVSQVTAVGMHGQTVYHGPHDKTPNTLQIGEPSFLAIALGCPVVSDFRAADIALNGEGAPLIPFFDAYIFGKKAPKILLNLGGIANISVVGKGVKTFGFDVGPANTLLDIACRKYFHKPFDKDGALSARGTPDKKYVAKLLRQNYFKQAPPKSLDKNTFGEIYLERYFNHFKNPYDLLATLAYFTAAGIAQAVTNFVPKNCQRKLVVSGGGVYNKTVLSFLKELLPHIKITTSAAYGIDPQAKESAAFAVMGHLALHKKINHCARATGSRKNTILGKITYAN
jgi:anhydro-N-acetylmuramic acid kinase